MTTKKNKGDDDVNALMAALQGAYAKQQAVNPVAVRDPERGVDDVVWNAVVMGHPNRFDDMPQVFTVAKLLVSKLIAFRALPRAAEPYGNVIFSAFLNFIWRSQNLMYLDPEMAAGWARALKVAAAQVASEWSPPTKQPWFPTLVSFPKAVDATLNKLKACKWEDVYKHLDPEMNALQKQAETILDNIASRHPAVMPAATGWIMGTIIEKDTFSPLDGSVPEDFDKHLTQIYEALERRAEGRFMPWLAAGFQEARERPMNELDRWRSDIGPEQPNNRRLK